MNCYNLPIFFFTLLSMTAPAYADTSFSTNFSGGEGYTSRGLNSTIQTGAPHFNESVNGGFYLPGGQGPGFGTVRKNPTTRNATAFYTTGEGSAFNAGATWTTRMDFKFEGLANTTPGSIVQLGGVGFSTSSSSLSNQIFAGIQKSATQTEAYQFYVFTPGGGFFSQNFSYSSVGDDTTDAHDQTDSLRMELSLTKSATADQFDFTATLNNLVNPATVSTITNTVTQSGAYSADLFGYFRSGSIAEANNFDLFDVDGFGYSASPIPEASTYAMIMGAVALLSLIVRRKKNTAAK